MGSILLTHPGSDRASLIPPHRGPRVLPASPLFTTLLRHASHSPPLTAIDDPSSNLSKTYLELLNDTLTLRALLRSSIDAETLAALDRDDPDLEVYVGIWAPGGYEYAVGMLAVLALGAACVPLSVAYPVSEAAGLVRRAGCSVLLVSAGLWEKGREVAEMVDRCTAVSIAPVISKGGLAVEEIKVDSGRWLDPNKPGVVIFTSGTTGPPKGAVMRRCFVDGTAAMEAEFFGVRRGHVLLHVLPVHHATGVGIMFFPFLMAGGRIEFWAGGFDERRVWERWREGESNEKRVVDWFSGVPTMYTRLMRSFERDLKGRGDVQEYVRGVRRIRGLLCGTSALPSPVDGFWRGLLGEGKRIVQRYGGTEFGAIFKMKLNGSGVPDGSVGECIVGVDVMLSDGQEGEVLVKSPHMFAKYLGDERATRSAHTEDGYYKTGDVARKEGKWYFILGRTSVDILKSGGYKISALDVEREAMALPYVAEIAVVGVADAEFGQRVAAAVVLRVHVDDTTDQSEKGPALPIERFRDDLRTRLAGYKLPTLLRLVDGELPKSSTGKISKKTLGPQLFPENYADIPAVQIWRRSRADRPKL